MKLRKSNFPLGKWGEKRLLAITYAVREYLHRVDKLPDLGSGEIGERHACRAGNH
ncbi:hypothetical protein [Sinorhizobium arboris]|uniref:hypothetical protein n=1 Tax=Sinorhizobium arboris TaxID=76745 RepID=UPI00130D5618|nr:hypothetical protein [Sinorhizobium arboris]